MKLLNVALLLAAAAPLAAHADDWKGKGQAGLLVSQGNTEAKSANAALELTRAVDGWKHAFNAAALYGKSGQVKSAERWSAGWQSDRDISPRLFGFGALRYGRDKFSGFQYRPRPRPVSATSSSTASPRSSRVAWAPAIASCGPN